MSADHKSYMTFVSDAFDVDAFRVLGFEGEEAISRPYRFEIDLVSRHPDLDVHAALSATARLRIDLIDEAKTVNGILASFEHVGPGTSGIYYYRAVLVPRIWLLGLSRQTQLYGTAGPVSVLDIIRHEMLGDGGQGIGDDSTLRLGVAGFEFRLSGSYAPKEHIVQYRETDLDFLRRLCEHEGIFFLFEQGETAEKVVFCDGNVHFPPIGERDTVAFRPPTGLAAFRNDTVHKITQRVNRTPGRVVLKDYNYRMPRVSLQGEAAVGGEGVKHGLWVEYGDHFRTPEEGSRLAAIRAEEIGAESCRFTARSACPIVSAGHRFDLEEHYRDDFNQRYLVVAVKHRAAQPTAGVDGIGKAQETERPDYTNEVELQPAMIPFRPPRVTPRPSVPGLMNAHVDASGSGRRAEIDSEGRYRVTMPFDLRGAPAARASRPMRMAQPYAGPNQGLHFPLIKGTEVVWACVDGNPDRPVICGAVPNPTSRSPVVQGNQAMNRIVTTSGMVMEMNDGMEPGSGGSGGPGAGTNAAQRQAGGPAMVSGVPDSGVENGLSADSSGGAERLPDQPQATGIGGSGIGGAPNQSWYKFKVPGYLGPGSDSDAYLRLGAGDGGDSIESKAFGHHDTGNVDSGQGRQGLLLYTTGDFKQKTVGASNISTWGPDYREVRTTSGEFVQATRTWDNRCLTVCVEGSRDTYISGGYEEFRHAGSFLGISGSRAETVRAQDIAIAAASRTSVVGAASFSIVGGMDYRRSEATALSIAKDTKLVGTGSILLTVKEPAAMAGRASIPATKGAVEAVEGVLKSAVAASGAAVAAKGIGSADFPSGKGMGAAGSVAAMAIAMAAADNASADKGDLLHPFIRIEGDEIVLGVGKSVIKIDPLGIKIGAPMIEMKGMGVAMHGQHVKLAGGEKGVLGDLATEAVGAVAGSAVGTAFSLLGAVGKGAESTIELGGVTDSPDHIVVDCDKMTISKGGLIPAGGGNLKVRGWMHANDEIYSYDAVRTKGPVEGANVKA